jgi:hypothetical protein
MKALKRPPDYLPGELDGLVRRLGGRIEDADLSVFFACRLMSPAGEVWAANGQHCFILCWPANHPDEETKALVNATAFVLAGTMPCENAICDYCRPDAP